MFVLSTSLPALLNTSCETAARLWYAERADYDFSQPVTDLWARLARIGHFSLMVWSDTTDVVR